MKKIRSGRDIPVLSAQRTKGYKISLQLVGKSSAIAPELGRIVLDQFARLLFSGDEDDLLARLTHPMQNMVGAHFEYPFL